MATGLNLEVIDGMGFAVPPRPRPNDMVVALRLEDDAERRRRPRRRRRGAGPGATESGASEVAPPRTTPRRFGVRRPARSSWSRCPGRARRVEAMDAIEAGHDVMVFSDNVPVEQEVALKRYAAERGAPRHGTRLRHRGDGRRRAGLRQHRASGTRRHRRRLGHRLPAAARACWTTPAGRSTASACAGRWESAGATCRRPSAVSPRARRCAGSTRTRTWTSSSSSPSRRLPRSPTALAGDAEGLGTPVELGLLGRGQRDLTAVAEAVLAGSGTRAPDWPVPAPTTPARRPAPPPRPLRRRHALRRVDADGHRRGGRGAQQHPALRGPGARPRTTCSPTPTRWSTSATTP